MRLVGLGPGFRRFQHVVFCMFLLDCGDLITCNYWICSFYLCFIQDGFLMFFSSKAGIHLTLAGWNLPANLLESWQFVRVLAGKQQR